MLPKTQKKELPSLLDIVSKKRSGGVLPVGVVGTRRTFTPTSVQSKLENMASRARGYRGYIFLFLGVAVVAKTGLLVGRAMEDVICKSYGKPIPNTTRGLCPYKQCKEPIIYNDPPPDTFYHRTCYHCNGKVCVMDPAYSMGVNVAAVAAGTVPFAGPAVGIYRCMAGNYYGELIRCFSGPIKLFGDCLTAGGASPLAEGLLNFGVDTALGFASLMDADNAFEAIFLGTLSMISLTLEFAALADATSASAGKAAVSKLVRQVRDGGSPIRGVRSMPALCCPQAART